MATSNVHEAMSVLPSGLLVSILQEHFEAYGIIDGVEVRRNSQDLVLLEMDLCEKQPLLLKNAVTRGGAHDTLLSALKQSGYVWAERYQIYGGVIKGVFYRTKEVVDAMKDGWRPDRRWDHGGLFKKAQYDEGLVPVRVPRRIWDDSNWGCFDRAQI